MSLLKGILQWSTVDEARRISQRLHPSRPYQPLRKLQESNDEPDCIFEQWQSDIYDVTVRRYHTDPPRVSLGICNADGSARHDWRDLQLIKNQLAGPDWEAVELFPAESRLLDPSNYFILHCQPSFPDIGFHHGRRIATPSTAIAPQRGWPKDQQPAPNYGLISQNDASPSPTNERVPNQPSQKIDHRYGSNQNK